jgi:5-dehydro-2-deoxygluconokinase
MNEDLKQTTNLGWNGQLYMLPFDHRANFAHAFFGNDAEPEKLTKPQVDTIREAKRIIYEGFKIAVQFGLPKSYTAILVDEYFGEQVIKDAIENNYIAALCVEKSGQEEFIFQYGEKFKEHILRYNPKIVKALVRYNPEGDSELNKRQLAKLKELSEFCHATKDPTYKFLLEPLVAPTEAQLESLGDDKTAFDKKLRAELTVKMIQDMQKAGVEPDIWKIEGLYTQRDYKKVVKQARASSATTDRKQVIVIVLGRAEKQATVEKWLKTGAKVTGVEGFAVGRTIFMEPLNKYIKAELTDKETAEQICLNFIHYYNIFKNTKNEGIKTKSETPSQTQHTQPIKQPL